MSRIGRILVWEGIRWWLAATGWIPGLLGSFFRCFAWRAVVGSMGSACRILEGVTIEHPRSLRIGNRVGLNRGVWISAHGGVEIGDDTIIGPYVVVHSANHRSSQTDKPIRQQGYTLKAVRIGADVWIGAHAVILPGVTIGSGSVVGAGAVVTDDIPERSIAVGVPARAIAHR